MNGSRVRLRALRIVAVTLIAGIAPVLAQDISVRLTSALGSRPYEPTYSFFTAQGSEAILNLGHVDGRCISTTSCTTDANCTAFASGVCAGSPLRCQGGVDFTVGQVVVLKKNSFCQIAACAGVAFADCGGVACPASQTYCGSPGNCHTCPAAEDLCMCDTGNMCEAPDAVLDPAETVFVDGFDSAANPNRWVLSGSSINPDPLDSHLVVGPGPSLVTVGSVTGAGTRFRVVAGQPYVLFLKRAIDPRTSWAGACNPYGHASLFVTTRAPRWCDLDDDGYAVTDCNDANAAIHPGAADTVCNGIDDNCDGLADDGTPRVTTAPALTLSRQVGGGAGLAWNPVAAAGAYDCVRGNLATLRSSSGDFTTSTNACLADSISTTGAADAALPVAGGGFWYLVRGVNTCLYAGPYDGGSARQSGSRDGEIAASPSACP